MKSEIVLYCGTFQSAEHGCGCGVLDVAESEEKLMAVINVCVPACTEWRLEFAEDKHTVYGTFSTVLQGCMREEQQLALRYALGEISTEVVGRLLIEGWAGLATCVARSKGLHVQALDIEYGALTVKVSY